MKRLFWKLLLIFLLAFAAIDFGHALALRLLHRFDGTGAAQLSLTATAGGARTDEQLAAYGATLLIALCASALLTWHLHRPVAILRRAFDAMSAGRLDTRVRHLLGSRRDGIADLGRDFDSMAERLQEHSAAQQRLVQEVSHELRSPLSRLQVAIGLAQQDPQKFHATLDRIENESLRLQAMLENMLTLAHVETGGAPLPCEEIDLIELVAAIARDARFEAQAVGSEVAFAGEGRCNARVRAELLGRAFDNVIRNAVKYTARGTLVEVVAHCDDLSLRVTVADRGPGVEAAMLALIFEPFYRVPTERRSAQGFGLGLAIARGAIVFHNGTIAAENRSGGGLVVTIALPLRSDAPQQC